MHTPSVRLACADVLEFLRAEPTDSVDLVFGSPPYADARTYGLDFKLKGEEWATWMTDIFKECNRICKGLVAFVVEGRTHKFQWTAEPALLMANLNRAGLKLRKPPAFYRHGISGSGGPDFWRNDYEFIVCTSRGKLPWSDNTAMGSPPRYGPGGAMSHRMKDGQRVSKPDGYKDGDVKHTKKPYKPPKIANPGNVIKCNVGGGHMGSAKAHKGEAPFPESLVERFALSFCPPGGTIMDPFVGTGTTGAVAIKHMRNFIGCDIRQSQIDITMERIGVVTPPLLYSEGVA